MLSDPTVNCLYCGSRATHQCNLSPYGYTDYCMAATSQFWVFIGQKMQLTDWENANNMRNETCADTQILNEWPLLFIPILCLLLSRAKAPPL